MSFAIIVVGIVIYLELRLWPQLSKLYTKKCAFGANNSFQYTASATRKHQGLNCSIILICHS